MPLVPVPQTSMWGTWEAYWPVKAVCLVVVVLVVDVSVVGVPDWHRWSTSGFGWERWSGRTHVDPLPEYCFKQVWGSQWAGVVSHSRACQSPGFRRGRKSSHPSVLAAFEAIDVSKSLDTQAKQGHVQQLPAAQTRFLYLGPQFWARAAEAENASKMEKKRMSDIKLVF